MRNSKISKYIIGGFILFYGIFFTKFSSASYVYIEPSPYFLIFSSFASGRTTSPAAGCEAIVQGYKLAAGSQYDARVQRVTETTPNVWSCYMDRKYILWP